MSSGKGLAIAGLILAILGAIMPVVGLYIGWIALCIAALAGFLGQRGLVVSTVIVSAVAFLFLTPSLWLEAAAYATGYGEATGSSPMYRIISIGLLVAPIAAMFIGTKKQTSS